MTADSRKILEEMTKKSGVSGGWPKEFNYTYREQSQAAEIRWVCHSNDKKSFRSFDTWGLAFLDHLVANGLNISGVNFILEYPDDDPAFQYNYESLKRRISYININNKENFSLSKNGREERLYSRESLYNRPSHEMTRDGENVAEKGDNDTPGRLEKDFQAFLFGKGLHDGADDPRRISDRLAILGEDFLRIRENLKTEELRWVCREFPTGAFRERVSEANRILPTEFVDIISLNKNGRFALIELKINDSQLPVAAQLLDYALFFRSYYWSAIQQTGKFINKHPIKKSDHFMCYVVNNWYHPRFDGVFFNYLAPKKVTDHGFRFSKLTLGHARTTR